MSGRFELLQEPMEGLKLLRRKRFGDERGYLSRLFDAEDMSDLGWRGGVFQINETVTKRAGTVRGMHYQHPPFAEAKLVTCLAGRVEDVVVDIRAGSPTFLKHFSVELSDDNALSLLIPEGFAHGFQTRVDDVRMIYAHSAPYRPEAEGGLHPLDPALAIAWPIAIEALSDRDRSHAPLEFDFPGVVL